MPSFPSHIHRMTSSMCDVRRPVDMDITLDATTEAGAKVRASRVARPLRAHPQAAPASHTDLGYDTTMIQPVHFTAAQTQKKSAQWNDLDPWYPMNLQSMGLVIRTTAFVPRHESQSRAATPFESGR